LASSILIFDEFLTEKTRRHSDNDNRIRKELESLAQYLLIQFNNILREIRRVADVCLAKLIDAFPFLLWNGTVITTALQIMKALIKNIDEDPGCTQSSIEFPWSDLPIQLQVSRINIIILLVNSLTSWFQGHAGWSEVGGQRLHQKMRANFVRSC